MVLAVLFSILVIFLGYLIYRKGTENEEYFTSQGFPCLKPKFFFGSSGLLMFDKKTTLNNYVTTLYNKMPTVKGFGMLDMRKPMLFLRDPALIKQICVKHADNFVDHRHFVDETMDTLFGNSLFLMRGQKWKEMRSTLSPAFTGHKMRLMFELVEEICGQMMKFLQKEAEGREVVSYEMKEMCSRFSNDIIALCAFGIKVDSMTEPDNAFFKAGQSIADFGSPTMMWKFFGFTVAPQLMRFFGIQLFGNVQTFFKEMVLGTMNVRAERKLVRPDMINLLMEIRKGTLQAEKAEDVDQSMGFTTVKDNETDTGTTKGRRDWTDDELVAQCFLFYAAGFDTSATAMSFAVYHLALDPEVQEKLYEEILESQSVLESAGKGLNYETLQRMKYMDQVVSETLRMYPTPITDRECTKDCTIDDGESFRLECKKKMAVWVPIWAIHR